MTIGTGGLKPKEKRFIAALIDTYNPTQAALHAGYQKGTARREGKRLTESLAVHIEEYGSTLMNAAQVSNIRTLREIALIAFHNPADMVDENDELLSLHELQDGARVVKSIKHVQTKEGYRKEYTFYSKLEALELLSKAGGLFNESVVTTQVNFYIGGGDEHGPVPLPESKYLPPSEEVIEQ